MNTRFRRLALVFSLGLLSAAMVNAQYPPPSAVVTIESLSASGANLGVHLSWEYGTGELPYNASLEIADSNGDDLTSVSFVPQWGQQTVWIPGGLPLQPSENGQPPRRNLELVGGPYEEVLISTDFTLADAPGPILIHGSSISKKTKKWCYLHLHSIQCVETAEPALTDQTYITVNGVTIWGRNMKAGDVVPINQVFCLGSSPGTPRSQVVKIMEADDLNPHETLGTLEVSSQSPTDGPSSQDFYRLAQGYSKDSHYILRYEIRCFRQRIFPC